MQIQMEGQERGNWICKGKGNYNQDILSLKKKYFQLTEKRKKNELHGLHKRKQSLKTPRKRGNTHSFMKIKELHEKGILQCPYNEVLIANGDCENSE